MSKGNKMTDMPVNKLILQTGIPMILSMALQAVYNIVAVHLLEICRQEVKLH